MLDISVLLCTHNPRADYLGRVLDALRNQTLSKADWELLIIDNASSEPLSSAWNLSWHPHARHLREDALGKMSAITLGIRESRGRLVMTVDDDNVLALDYLARAAAIAEIHPEFGAFGAGTLEGDFEVEPPRVLRSRLNMIAVRTVSAAEWSNKIEDIECIPWGAGLCVTREVAEAYRHFAEASGVASVVGPRGQRLFRGDDDLFSWIAAGLGLYFGLFPELRVTHLIHAARLNQEYFLRLFHDHSFSHSTLRFVLAGDRPRRIPWVRYARLPLHAIRYGVFSMRCRWAALRGTARAARFIAEERLEPIQNVAWLPK